MDNRARKKAVPIGTALPFTADGLTEPASATCLAGLVLSTEAASLLEAVPAINRTVATRGKRDLSVAAAFGANGRIHLTLAALAISAAKVAALFTG